MNRTAGSRFEWLLLATLLGGLAATALAVDPYCLKPFRDEKEALFLLAGGILCLGLAGALLFRGARPAPRNPVLFLLPFAGLAVWRFWVSLQSETVFGQIEPGLPVATDYLLKILGPLLAAIPFWLVASNTRLSRKKIGFLALFFTLLLGIETVGVGAEIVGALSGHDWRPFLGGAFIEAGQTGLKTNYFGSFGNANFLAGFFSLFIFFPLCWGFGSGTAWKRASLFLLAAGTLGILVVCRSKGVFLGLLLASVWTSAVLYRAGRRRSVLSVAGLFVGLLVISGVFLKLSGGEGQWSLLARLRGESLTQRVLLAYTGIEMWKERPLLGVGPGGYRVGFLDALSDLARGENADAVASRVDRLKSLKPVHTHNDYLEILVEWGLVGHLSFLVFIAAVGVSVWRRLRSAEGAEFRFRLAASSSMAAGLGYALFEFPLHLPFHLGAILTFGGLALAPTATEKERPVSLWSRVPQTLLLLAVGLFLIGRGVAVWEASRLANSGALKAATASKRGERADALREMERAALLDPGNSEVGLLLAQGQWKLRDRPDAAIRTLRRGREIADAPSHMTLETRILLEAGKIRDASISLSRIRPFSANLPGVGYLEGRLEEAFGHAEEAEAAYARDLRAIANHPDTPKAALAHLNHLHLRYGGILESAGKYRQAIRQYEKLADLDSNIPLALSRLGAIYRDRYQDYPTAKRYFERAIESAKRSQNQAAMDEAKRERSRTLSIERKAREAADVVLSATEPTEVYSNQNE